MEPTPVGLPTRSTAVVRLPGAAGGGDRRDEKDKPFLAVSRADRGEGDRDLRRPIDRRAERRASVRIVVAHQGRGVLDEVSRASRRLAEDDGRFFLAGLTPGRYLVQAARDGIWLSNAVVLVAEESKPLPKDHALDIAEPGAQVADPGLVDADGRPLADESVRPIRPRGRSPRSGRASSAPTRPGSPRCGAWRPAGTRSWSARGPLRHEFAVPEARGAVPRPVTSRVTLARGKEAKTRQLKYAPGVHGTRAAFTRIPGPNIPGNAPGTKQEKGERNESAWREGYGSVPASSALRPFRRLLLRRVCNPNVNRSNPIGSALAPPCAARRE